MSAVAYGAITRKRDEAPKNESRKTASPGVKTYVDAMAALVPAEVLALHALMIQSTTETEKVGGQSVTTITEAGTLTATFWVCVVLSIVLFVFGRLAGGQHHWERADYARMLIPPAAFVLWTILQATTAFDATWPDAMDESARQLVGVTGAIVVGGLAALLGVKLDKQAPPT